MKKLLLTITLFCGFCGIAAAQAQWAQFSRYEEANAQVSVRPKAVFMGDSITDAWFRQDPEFFTSNNFLGRGISGQVTSQMLVRLRRDVISHKPKYMVLLGGINDIAGNQGEISVEDSFGNIVSMVELAKANRIKPILCLLFPTTTIGWRPEVGNPLEKVEQLNSMIRGYGKAHHIPVVEYLSGVDKSSGRLPETYSKDSIHPNLEGYKIMEQEILKYLK